MSATSANSAEFQDGGKPVANPVYSVDTSGNPISSTNPLPVTATLATASAVEILDSGGTNKLAVDASGRITLAPNQTVEVVDSAGTNKLAVDASGRLTLVPNQTVKVVDSAGTNQLAVDASGRLTLIPNSSVNVAQVAGVAPGLDNTNEQRVSVYGKATAAGDTPFLLDSAGRMATIDLISNYTNLGQVFVAAAKISNSTTVGGISVFNNSQAKNVLIFSCTVTETTGAANSELRLNTADPAFGTNVTPVNLKAGGSASVIPAGTNGASSAASGLTIAGTLLTGTANVANAGSELLTNGRRVLLPAGAANGLAFYVSFASAGTAILSVTWMEF